MSNVEEQIYKIVDTESGQILMTGRTKNPTKRAKQYARYSWWKPQYKLEPYRIIARNGFSDEDYGMYAAAVEHMEICRNRTWNHQGGRNKMSPLRQLLWGPEARAEVGYWGGLVAGKIAVDSRQLEALRTAEHQQTSGIAAGKKHKENGTGLFSLTPEQRSELGRRNGLRHKENKTGVCAPENVGKGGRAVVRSGLFATYRTEEHQRNAGRIGGKVGGPIGGKRTAAIPGHMSKAGQLGGRATVEKAVGIFGLTTEQKIRNARKGGAVNAASGHMARIQKINVHIRWHVNRNITNPNCGLCQLAQAA